MKNKSKNKNKSGLRLTIRSSKLKSYELRALVEDKIKTIKSCEMISEIKRGQRTLFTKD